MMPIHLHPGLSFWFPLFALIGVPAIAGVVFRLASRFFHFDLQKAKYMGALR